MNTRDFFKRQLDEGKLVNPDLKLSRHVKTYESGRPIRTNDIMLFAFILISDITLIKNKVSFKLISIHQDELGVIYIIDKDRQMNNKSLIPYVKKIS